MLSSEKVIGELNENCEKLAIPNIFFKGYFPQLCPNPNNPFIGSQYNREGIFPYGDKNIKSMMEEGMKADEIAAIISKYDFYKIEEIQQVVKNSLKELREREQKCDITISDFIEENYFKERLFYVPNHPTNTVIQELTKRILKYLGYYTYSMNTENIPENNNLEIPIYPSVLLALGAAFKHDKIYFCRKFFTESVTLSEYVQIYIQYCTDK